MLGVGSERMGWDREGDMGKLAGGGEGGGGYVNFTAKENTAK